jgi:hypothetical protein
MPTPDCVLTSPHQPGSSVFDVSNISAVISARGGVPTQIVVDHPPSTLSPVFFSGTFSVLGATANQIQGVALIAGTDGFFSSGDTVTFQGVLPQPGGGGTPGGSSGQIQFNNGGVLGGTTNFNFDATNTCPQLVAQADPAAPAAGDMWLSTVSGAPKIYRAPGLGGSIGQCIFSCGPCAPVVNTTALTSIFGSPTGVQGSLTTPANKLAAGNVLRWVLTAQYSCSGSPTISASVLLGGAEVLSSPAAFTLSTNVTNQLVFSGVGQLTIIPDGESTGASGIGSLVYVQSFDSQPTTFQIVGGGSPVPFVSFDSSEATTFDIQVAFGTASPSNSFQAQSFNLFLDS